MKKKLLNILVCPVCKGSLRYVSVDKELICDKDRLAFPVRDKTPVLLITDSRQLD